MSRVTQDNISAGLSVTSGDPVAKGAAGGIPDVINGEDPSSNENASPDAHAFLSAANRPGLLEEVDPDVSTYESQRAASEVIHGLVEVAGEGVAAAALAAADDYALMLDQMKVGCSASIFHELLSCWCLI